MMETLRGIVLVVMRWLLTRLTEPQTLGVEGLDAATPLVYVLANPSLTDLVMLDIATQAHGLPRPRESMVRTGVPERRRFFFLNTPSRGLFRRNVMRAYPQRLLRLQRHYRETRRHDLCLVPVTVFWSRAPSKERSLIRVLLSENWTITSRFRRLVVILFNRHDITVQFASRLRFDELDDGTLSEPRLARRIARHLRVAFKNQRTALLGPDLSHRRTLVTRITSSRSVRDAIRAEAERKQEPITKVLRRARKQADEIASDVSYITIRLFDRILTWFWNRIYDGMDVNGIDRLKKQAETATLVYVPCHRSHVDYLVLSYVLYYQGLVIPHIAAGDNLNLPVIGPLLRRAGAFFMRRRFADDRLYSAVFNEYLHQVLQRGSSVKYFIEGGRSRTGRLLPPRTGLLNMTIASAARGLRRPIVFVPVYIGYEKLIEARTYVRELEGSQKKRESIADIVRTLKVVRERFGRVHVNFGEPLPLQEFVDAHAAGGAVARELGLEILRRINACADVNPVNLVALVMLSAPRLAMDGQLLAEQLDCFAALLRSEAAQTGISVTAMAGDDMIRHAEALGLLIREMQPFGDVLSLDGLRAVLMTWYRNNSLHTLALPALIACLVFNRRRPLDREQLLRMVETVYPYVASELFVRVDEDTATAVDRWLDRMCELGLLRRHSDGQIWAPTAESTAAYRLELLAAIVMPMLERFFIVVAILEQVGQGQIDRATLEAQCLDVARRISRLHGLNAPEFFDPRLFHGFVDTLIARAAASTDAGGYLYYGAVVTEVVRAASAVLPVSFRHAVLRARLRPERAASPPQSAAPR